MLKECLNQVIESQIGHKEKNINAVRLKEKAGKRYFEINIISLTLGGFLQKVKYGSGAAIRLTDEGVKAATNDFFYEKFISNTGVLLRDFFMLIANIAVAIFAYGALNKDESEMNSKINALEEEIRLLKLSQQERGKKVTELKAIIERDSKRLQ